MCTISFYIIYYRLNEHKISQYQIKRDLRSGHLASSHVCIATCKTKTNPFTYVLLRCPFTSSLACMSGFMLVRSFGVI